MKAREFWLLFAPSLVVMGGLLVLPLIRTVQWSLENVRLRRARAPSSVSRTSPTR